MGNPTTMADIFPKAMFSVPSWVIPGTYLENLRFLENKTDIRGVELLFFIYDSEIRLQLNAEWEGILQFKDRFVFTAHLPDPLLPEHEELVERLDPLARSFVAHPGPAENAPALAALLKDWEKKYPPRSGFPGAPPPGRFLAENTHVGRLDALLPYLGSMGLCMDTGHLLLEGKSPADYFRAHRERIGEIHLHGIDREKAALDGRLADHRAVQAREEWFRELFPLLREFAGVINTEVFSWEEAAAGMERIKLFADA
ncbi:MAG: AP endonuclease [Treponema sp.]|jgi:hypothetical protein|nr:AP endonuclease [Treponema sp.]